MKRFCTMMMVTAMMLLSITDIWAGTEAVSLDDIAEKKPGNTVTITGTTTIDEMTIKVIAPNTTVLYMNVVSGEHYISTFDLPADAATGTYTVVAGRGAFIAVKNFEVIGMDEPVIGVRLNCRYLRIREGSQVQLLATVAPANAANKSVTWSSSDESVVTVDSDGFVTAVGRGRGTITVITDDGGYTAKCSVWVKKKRKERNSGEDTISERDILITDEELALMAAVAKPLSSIS